VSLDWLRPPSPSFYRNKKKVEAIVVEAERRGRVLDAGSKSRKLTPRTVGIDLGFNRAISVQADVSAIPFRDGSFSLVVSQAVLHLVRDPRLVAAEFSRVLAPGGRVYIEAPFLQGYMAEPVDRQRFTLPGLVELFEDFRPIDSGVCVGPASALVWILREYASALAGGGRLGQFAKGVAGWVFAPLKYLDLLVASRPEAARVAAGFYFYGEKIDRAAK
jgi:SAM-dependent methyltransferase